MLTEQVWALIRVTQTSGPQSVESCSPEKGHRRWTGANQALGPLSRATPHSFAPVISFQFFHVLCL